MARKEPFHHGAEKKCAAALKSELVHLQIDFDAAAVRDYALRYLDPDRHVQVTLLPERESSEGSAMRHEDAPGAELRR